MLRRTIFCGLILLAMCAFFGVDKANAQEIYGATGFDIDPNLRKLYGYHLTEVDFIAWEFYEPRVDGFILDEFENVLDFDGDVNHTGFRAEASTEITYQPGRTYYVISDHYVGLLIEQPPSGGGGGLGFWNPFGFGFAGPSGGGYNPFWGFMPGPGGFVTVQYIYLGTTGWILEFFGEPHINQISPPSAPVDTDIEVHFEGTNLGGNPSVNISGSGVTTGQVVFSTETRLSLVFHIAANAPTGNRSVTISTRGYTTNSVTFHVGDRTPHINSISPSRGDTGSIVDVTISGTNFGVNPAIFVTGGISASVLAGSTATQINSRFTIPANTVAGDHQVTVFSNGVSGSGFIGGSGSATSNSVSFTVNAAAAPRITNYSPQAGQLDTTIEINVVGQNFGVSRSLVIGGQGVTVQSYTPVSDPDHQIVATLNIAANAQTGDHSIRVSSGGQLSNSVNFRVGDPSPVITSITPDFGETGTTFNVTIVGRGFGSNPTVGVSGTGVTVIVNQKNNTNIQAVFQIASSTAPVQRQVTVTSQGANGNGFMQSPGTNQSASTPFDITKAKATINSMDDQFAPSVERLNIAYTISPAPFARLEIFKKDDHKNPIFVDNGIATGTAAYTQNGNTGWDGVANQGADSGKHIGPEGSPYKVVISISDTAAFTNRKSDDDSFKIEMFVEASMPPVPPRPGRSPEPGSDKKEYTVIKPWNPNQQVTELDTTITLKVMYLGRNNNKVGIALPYSVEWSFTDPDDTSSEAEIDSSPGGGKDGDDNAPIAKGGKRPVGSQTSTMWKAVAGFTFASPQGQTATSDLSILPGPDQGATKVRFSSSAIGGDNYVLAAAVKNASGKVLANLPFEKWSVRKALDFSAAYQMPDGADPQDYVSTNKVKGAFEGEGYTDYRLQGGVRAFPTPTPTPTPSPAPSPTPTPSDYFAQLLAPNAAETPTSQEIAAYTGPPGTAKTAATTAITNKAQAWYVRNLNGIKTAQIAAVTAINPNAAAVIGAKALHPKYDGLKGDARPSNAAKFYPDGIVIREVDGSGTVIPGSSQMDPNLDWTQAPGDTGEPERIAGEEVEFTRTSGGQVTIIKIAFLYKDLQSAASNPTVAQYREARKRIVGRHEIGHASDHVPFAELTQTDPSEMDHWTSGLMHRTAEQSGVSPGNDSFANNSIRRLRGWKR